MMPILIGLALAAALLYFWLIGHWFARVLMFLLLAWISTEPSPPNGGRVKRF